MWSFMKLNNLLKPILFVTRSFTIVGKGVSICSIIITGLHYHETNKQQYWNIKTILTQMCKKEFTEFSLPIFSKLIVMEV